MPTASQDFQGLVARAGQGDREAFRLLAEQYEPKIRAVAKVRLGPALRSIVDSTDLVQSVHRLVLAGLHAGAYEFTGPEQLINLAVKIVYRRIAQHWRKEQVIIRAQGGGHSPGDSMSLIGA